MPVGDVLICDTRRHVKHDDTSLSIDVVSIAKTTELLLASGVPDVELDLAKVLSALSVCCIWAHDASGEHTVVKPRGWTSTPRVAMYFFSNSPVKWRLTKVVWKTVGVSRCYALEVRRAVHRTSKPDSDHT